MDLSQPFSLEAIRDHQMESDHLYNFRGEPQNKLEDNWVQLSNHLRLSLYNQAGNPHLDLIHTYLDEHLDFLRWDLLPACHTTGGTPARGPEVNSVKVENTPDFFRNVFIYNGYFYFLTKYHKARVSINFAFYVTRFFPPTIGRLLYTYIVYVRPVMRMLAHRYNPYQTTNDTSSSQSTVATQAEEAQSTYLFADPLKNKPFWPTTVLSQSLKRTY